jgi:hypothetical protein
MKECVVEKDIHSSCQCSIPECSTCIQATMTAATCPLREGYTVEEIAKWVERCLLVGFTVTPSLVYDKTFGVAATAKERGG